MFATITAPVITHRDAGDSRPAIRIRRIDAACISGSAATPSIIARFPVRLFHEEVPASFQTTNSAASAVPIARETPIVSAFRMGGADSSIRTGRGIALLAKPLINDSIAALREAAVRPTGIGSRIAIAPPRIALFVIRPGEECFISFINASVEIVIDFRTTRLIIWTGPLLWVRSRIRNTIPAELEEACRTASIERRRVSVVTFFIAFFPPVTADFCLTLVVASVAGLLNALKSG